MTTVRGIEAIKLYIPPTQTAIPENVIEETGRAVVICEEAQQLDESAITMTSVERYRQEWLQLLSRLDTDPESIRDAAFKSELRVSKFRSVHWALLLRVLNADHSSWCIQRAKQRMRYEKFSVDFVRNPHEIDVPDDDPLSQSTKSIWNQYFSDQELYGVIRQDVVRTFPGVDFFRKQIIQNAMSNILFYYAREHPYMCYRQGMHEILAPIIFVIYGDHQSLLHYKEIVKTDINETLFNVLNPQYLEADAYSIFSRLMSSVESYYRISTLMQTPCADNEIPITTHIDAAAVGKSDAQTEVEVIGQLNLIRDKILSKEDLHLHNYLLKMDIPLHIFGIRWLRLLFGREFPLLDLLILWDAIFADSDRFDLPNYILVAMLVHIREKLLLSDYTTSLTYLMRYPTNVDVNLVLQHALHMLNPKKFELPPDAIAFMSFSQASDDSSSTSTRKTANSSISSAVATPQHSTTIDKNNDITKMDRLIQYQQKRNAADDAALAKLKFAPQGNRIAMDGYSENSPELMRLELKNAQTVIKVARNKLQTYLSTVRKHVEKQNNISEELEKTLDGIEELCSFLDIKFMFPLHAGTVPIDQAHEAQDIVQREIEQIESPQTPKTMQQQQQQTTNQTPIAAQLNYEKPERALMSINSARLIGNKREIELIAITSDEKPWQLLQNGLPAADPQAAHHHEIND